MMHIGLNVPWTGALFIGCGMALLLGLLGLAGLSLTKDQMLMKEFLPTDGAAGLTVDPTPNSDGLFASLEQRVVGRLARAHQRSTTLLAFGVGVAMLGLLGAAFLLVDYYRNGNSVGALVPALVAAGYSQILAMVAFRLHRSADGDIEASLKMYVYVRQVAALVELAKAPREGPEASAGLGEVVRALAEQTRAMVDPVFSSRGSRQGLTLEAGQGDARARARIG